MTYLSCGIQERLQQAFAEHKMAVDIKSDYIIAKDSLNCTREKIQQIIQSAGFCPVVSGSRVTGNCIFTVVPYRIPQDFTSRGYLSAEEIADLLGPKKVVRDSENTYNDKWFEMNTFRGCVEPALNQVLSEILAASADNLPIVEIGSGVGYGFSQELLSKMIRTQPDHTACQVLSRSTSHPIYQVDIEEMYNCLASCSKKVHLFFALNVFDTLSPHARKTSFSQLSQLQNRGDRIVIMLDVNPFLETTLPHLEALYPGHVAMPYYPIAKGRTSLSAVMLPLQHVSHKPSKHEVVKILYDQVQAALREEVSAVRNKLYQQQQEFNLDVVELESFFAQQVKKELEEASYDVRVYYHASFVPVTLSQEGAEIQQDILYKSIADIATLRQWDATSEKWSACLASKGLKMPKDCDAAFLASLRQQGRKLLGAEVLVIEGRKL